MPAPPSTASGQRALQASIRTALAAAHVARQAGDHREGAAQCRLALAQAEQIGQRGAIAQALAGLALNEMRLGNVEMAVSHGHRALPLLRRSRDAGERAQLLCTLVLCYIDMGLPADALGFATQAIHSARACGDRTIMSWALNRAGITYEALGDAEHGEPLLAEGLSIARQERDDEAVFSALNNLCSNLLGRAPGIADEATRAELLARALAFGTEALACAVASGNGHREAICESNMAVACTALGHYDEALRHIANERDIAVRNGYRNVVVTALANRAALERHRGDLAASIRFYGEALAEASGADSRAMLCEMHQGLYECHKLLGDTANALRHHEAIRPLEREQLRQQADRQARLLLNRLEIESAQAAAQRAGLDAEVQRLRAVQLESENQQLEIRAIELGRTALEDQLTGLANRRRIDQELPGHLARARENATSLSVAAIDLDHFKHVNDTHGHAIGDDVLRAVACLFVANTREGDLLARMGGEEFLLLFDATQPDVAEEVCERLRAAVEHHDWSTLAPQLRVTVSIGVCHATPADAVPRELLERADAALYDAKRGGRNLLRVAA